MGECCRWQSYFALQSQMKRKGKIQKFHLSTAAEQIQQINIHLLIEN